jgi:hypothetical protein
MANAEATEPKQKDVKSRVVPNNLLPTAYASIQDSGEGQP